MLSYGFLMAKITWFFEATSVQVVGDCLGRVGRE